MCVCVRWCCVSVCKCVCVCVCAYVCMLVYKNDYVCLYAKHHMHFEITRHKSKKTFF